MCMPQFMTEHLRYDRPERPQSYLEHGTFAAKHSLWLIVAGAAGLVHAVFPWWFRFYTTEQVVRIYRAIATSGHHDDLIVKYGLPGPRQPVT